MYMLFLFLFYHCDFVIYVHCVFFLLIEEFQRAARAVTGKRVNDSIVNTVFLLFDADGDGHLSAEEFISVTRSYLARGTRGRVRLLLITFIGKIQRSYWKIACIFNTSHSSNWMNVDIISFSGQIIIREFSQLDFLYQIQY